MAEINKEVKNDEDQNKEQQTNNSNANLNNDNDENKENDQNDQNNQDIQMTDNSKDSKDVKSKDIIPKKETNTKKDTKKDSKRHKKRDSSSRQSSHRSRDSGDHYSSARHRDRYRPKSPINSSRSRSRSRSPSHDSRPRRAHRDRGHSRSHSPSYARNHRSRRDKDYHRRRSRHPHPHTHRYRDRRDNKHSNRSSRSRRSHSQSQSRSRSPKQSQSRGKDSHKTSKDNNASLHGPTMDIRVTVFPKSTPGESKIITLNIARTSTVSDFKGTLCARGFNVFLQYNLYVRDKELDVSDDRLLCIHVGIKPNDNDKHIVVSPKNTTTTSSTAADEYDPFLATATNNTTTTTTTTDNKKIISKKSEEELLALKKKRETERADQIEMYKAYEEMFGVEEAAGMMGLDPAEIKRIGIEAIIDRLDEEKERKRLDMEAAEAARSSNSMGGNNSNNNMSNSIYDYSEEMLFAQTAQMNGMGGSAQYNDNLIDYDTAVGTTHTAGGGTVSRPPPEHVSENACIFVGDLHPMVTRSDLLSVFSQIGQVQWIQLFDCHKQMNRPFNFAFVYFEDLLCARNAIQKLNYTKFYGSPCRLMWKQEKNSVQWTDCNIIVKNLPPNTDSQLLHSVFSKFGKILSSKVKTTATGRTLPYGYVQYGSKDGADKAIIASDKGELSVNGHMLTAEWFKSREDRAFRQIYVKNIPNNWSDQDLLNLFEAQTLGKIKSFTVKHSPYGRWACISFHEPHHAVKAIDKLNNCPTGDPLSPNLSVSRFMYKTERDKFKSITTAAAAAMSATAATNILSNANSMSMNNPLGALNGLNALSGLNSNILNNAAHSLNTHQCYSIYVGNVPLQLTDEHMRQLFEPFGAVISAAVVQKTQDYKYGFVNFQQPEDAARALVTMNGKSIGGKTLQVKPANTDMSKAIAITQAANANLNNLNQINNISNQMTQQQHIQSINQSSMGQQSHSHHNANKTSNIQPNITHKQAKEILLVANENKEKVWKVQYGEDWHEYDTTLAAIVEQLQIGEQIQITLADSNYIITRIQQEQAMQKNCASGTMRKVVRSTRDLQ